MLGSRSHGTLQGGRWLLALALASAAPALEEPSVQFTTSTSSGEEAGGVLIATVSLSGPAGGEVVVPFTGAGSMTLGEDCNLDVASPIVLPAGQLSAEITLTGLDDALDEEDEETWVLSLQAPTGATLGANTTHAFSIADDDDPPLVEFSALEQSSGEDDGVVTVAVALSQESGRQVTVPFTVGGTALDPDDYGLSAAAFVLAGGETEASIDVSPVADSLHEADETVVLSLGAPTNASLGAGVVHTLTLVDGDAPPTVEFQVSEASVPESAGSTAVTLQLSAISGQDVVVPFTVTGEALDPEDYGLDASPVVIPAGVATFDLTLDVVDDALDEADEDVVVTLGAPTGASLGSSSVHTTTLLDDDAPPVVGFQLGSSSQGEGAGGVDVVVTLSAPSSLDLIVPFSVSGEATPGEDYTTDASPLLIPAGATAGALAVTPVADALYEGDEELLLDLGVPTNGSLGGATTHSLTLLDDDEPPLVEFASAGQVLGEAAGTVGVVVQLSAPSGLTVSVPFSASGTASEPDDYTLDPGPLLIPAGQTSADLVLHLADDLLYELEESIDLTLAAPTGGQLGGQALHSITLASDDAPPTVEFGVASSSAPEGVGAVLIDLQLSAVSGVEVTVPVSASGGEATQGADYDLDGASVLIPAGGLTGSCQVTVLPDALDEPDEAVELSLGTPVGAELGSLAAHALTLLDDDEPPSVAFQLPQQKVDEAAGVVAVTLELSGPSGRDVTVPFSLGGTATPGSDFSVTGGSVVLPAGQTTADLLVTVLDDAEDEGKERVRVLLDVAGLVHATPGDLTSHRLTITDNDGPGFLLDVDGLQADLGELEFDVLTVGGSDGPYTVVATNVETMPITFEGVVFEGDHPADFAVAYVQPMPVLLQPGDSAAFEVTYQPTEYGERLAVARLRQTPAGVPPGEVRLSGLAVGLPGEELRMNVGPDEYVDAGLGFWARDYGVSGESAYVTTSQSISGTEDDELFRVARVGGSFGYGFELPDGEYDVVLHFAETEVFGVGERLFDVFLEGARVINDLDLFATAGWMTAWPSPPLRTTVSDGVLNLDLVGSSGDALLSALEVRSVPLVSSDTASVDFGVVDQGTVEAATATLLNSGLAGATITQVALVLDAGSSGSGEDFHVRLDGSDYHGGDASVYYAVDVELSPGEALPLEVFFGPTEHKDHELVVELGGDFGELSIELSGTGGANSDWGFLHPVISYSPELVVDYDQDGAEEVTLLAYDSHTHEPGQALASYEWSQDGSPFSSSVEASLQATTGETLVELTIVDDKPTPHSATEDLELKVHRPDSVPGVLVAYYDGLGDPGSLLDAVPSFADHLERVPTPEVFVQGGQVGGSAFVDDVMVTLSARFEVPSTASYEFVLSGGAATRVFVDGQPFNGPDQLRSGRHNLEVRFAVTSLSQLPLRVLLEVDGEENPKWSGSLVHDVENVPPVLHSMPTVGSDLGGNLISLEGFAFFPKDEVTVHWGSADLTLADFESWGAEQIQLYSPPGNGTISVYVETPNGISNAIDFHYSPGGPVPVRFDLRSDRALVVPGATTGVWHPNGNLFVGTLSGKIYEIAYDDDWVSSYVVHDGVSGLTNPDVLGVAINPYDPPSPVKLYVSHGEHFLNGGGAFSGPSPFTGQVSVLTGPSFDDPVPLITGLPTSNHDHSVNGMEFDNNGDLLVTVGGNTNAGVPWPLIGDVPESPFSGAVIRALTSRADFNGAIQYVSRIDGTPIDNQVLGREAESDGTAHVEVFASGQRNPYDLVLTTSGRIYATDNGPNTGYGPASDGPDSDTGIHPQHPDELNLLREGAYYGHANRNRGDGGDERQYVWRDTTDPAGVDYTPPMHLVDSSTNGLAEYRAQTFNGQLRGQLVAQRWNWSQYLLELDEDGDEVVGELLIQPTAKGLDVVAGPGGSLLTLDYTGSKVRILEPDDASAVGVVVHDVLPWRATEVGGTPFVIGGEGFVDGATTVTVAGVPCTVTAVTPRRIRGVLPSLPLSNVGSLHDLVVKVSATEVSLPSAILILPASPGQMTGFWTTGPSLPDPLGEVAAGVVDSKMYVFGEGTNKTYAYDLLAGAWSEGLAARPFPGNHHACEVVDGRVYLIGGLGGGSAGRVQIYDPVTDSWTTGQDMPWSGGSCSSGVVDGKIYVCGGIVGSATVKNLSVYDPVLDDWDQGGALNLAPMATKVNHAAAASDGSRLWVFGGRQGGNWPQAGFDTVQCYDPVTDSWDSSDQVQSSLAPMPLPRGGTGRAVHYKGELYVFGGEDDSVAFGEVQVYRPSTNAWRAEAELPTPRHGVFPVLYQGRMYLAGGGVVAGFSASDILEIFQRP